VDVALLLGPDDDLGGPWPVPARIVGHRGHALQMDVEVGQPGGGACRIHPPHPARGGHDDQVATEHAVAVLEEASPEQPGILEGHPRVLHHAPVGGDAHDLAGLAVAGEDLADGKAALVGSAADGGDLDLVGEAADGREGLAGPVACDQLEVARLAGRVVDKMTWSVGSW
jgi:hypothetical protein